jgi:hypothetical protein
VLALVLYKKRINQELQQRLVAEGSKQQRGMMLKMCIDTEDGTNERESK